MSKKDDILKVMKEISEQFGKGTVYTLGSPLANRPIPRMLTGIPELDSITGGGLPLGRIIEIYGAESAGKTTLAYKLAAQFETAVFIPIEGTFNADRARIFGNKKGQLIIARAEYGEDAMSAVIKFAKAGVGCIVIDSVPSCIPKEEFENAITDLQKENRRGGVARLLTKTLPPLINICERTGTVVIFINQIRDKMNALAFGVQTTTPGGHMLKHACSLRIKVARRKWLEVPNKNTTISAKKEKIGLVQKISVEKSKVCNPYGAVETNILFAYGYLSKEVMQEKRKEIMAENNIKYKKVRK